MEFNKDNWEPLAFGTVWRWGWYRYQKKRKGKIQLWKGKIKDRKDEGQHGKEGRGVRGREQKMSERKRGRLMKRAGQSH